LCKLYGMAFVITDPCIGTKDTACVDVCPVDCIHPRKDEAEFEQTSMLFIHPDDRLRRVRAGLSGGCDLRQSGVGARQSEGSDRGEFDVSGG
jgi:NAD-dependent dihydropyrimidine dehydrogenase PreA subunit